jgi:ketopantoate reductase
MKTLIVGAGASGGIEYSVPGTFDLIVLATKAQGAIEVAPSLVRFLAPGALCFRSRTGEYRRCLQVGLWGECVIGGLSNLGTTMLRPGIHEQRNAVYLLIGELGGGKRAKRTGASGSVVQ